MFSSSKKLIIIIFLLIGFAFIIKSALAEVKPAPDTCKQGWLSVSKIPGLGQELIPKGCRCGKQESNSECGVNQIIEFMINITRLILGVMGSFALLMFTIGGLYYIISFGNSSRVEKAKSVITAAVWGLVIILTAWTIINFIVIALTVGGSGIGGKGTIFNKPWTNLYDEKTSKGE